MLLYQYYYEKKTPLRIPACKLLEKLNVEKLDLQKINCNSYVNTIELKL